LTHIQEKGLQIGKRWIISEEGTQQALCIRDVINSQAKKDSRYAMNQGKYVDL